MNDVSTPEVFHGPYPAVPDEALVQFVVERCGYVPSLISTDLADAAQSINQYERHCEAVKAAMRAGRIQSGVGHFIMAKTLKPWDEDLRYLLA